MLEAERGKREEMRYKKCIQHGVVVSVGVVVGRGELSECDTRSSRVVVTNTQPRLATPNAHRS